MTKRMNYLRYLELAKASELADELSSKGFTVEIEASTDNVVFDLLAKKGVETIAYAIKAAGSSRLGRSELKRVQDVARIAGYEFRIVVVNPPPRINVEVDDLRSHLLDFVNDHIPDELNLLSSGTMIDGLSDLEIFDIKVHSSTIEIKGTGSVDVTLQYGGGSDHSFNNDSYPFTFAAILNHDTSLASVDKFDVDTSSFYED